MDLLELNLPFFVGLRLAHGEELTFKVGREAAVDGNFICVLCILPDDLPLNECSSVCLIDLQAQSSGLTRIAGTSLSKLGNARTLLTFGPDPISAGSSPRGRLLNSSEVIV
jgi:hypothetical protein